MDNAKGVIFNIQKFSIHDGTGIRTLIFMKGCPLRCLWCSNPESQHMGIEIMDVKAKCKGCGKCVAKCGQKGIDPETFSIDRNACIKCGECAKFCFAEGKKVVGREVTIYELMKTIEKDRIFYRNSGGGVTVGGGEPTMQSAFVAELLKKCRESHIHTAIETCGYGSWDQIKGVFEHADQIFYDLKCMDPDQHKALTGVDNGVILENARKAAKLGKETIFRLPLIPALNDGEENIRDTGAFVKDLMPYNDHISMEILPYHNFGRDKYRWLNVEYQLEKTEKPLQETVAQYNKLLEQMGIRVIPQVV